MSKQQVIAMVNRYIKTIRKQQQELNMSKKKFDDEPSDMVDGFRAMDEHRKQVNADNLASNGFRLKGACEELGILVEKVTDYHYRIGGWNYPPLDVYPTSGKYHNIRTGKRGVINGSYTEFLKSQLKDILPALQLRKKEIDQSNRGKP